MSSNLARSLNPSAPANASPVRPNVVSEGAGSRRSIPLKNTSTLRSVNAGQATLAVVSSILVGVNIAGAAYYAAPMSVRVRHPLHTWLRPSGTIGQGAGIVAFTIFAFLWLYPLRKRFKSLAWTGSVGRWLDVHVTAALTLPLLLPIHAAWRFDGVIGLGYIAMMMVCGSGVVGRYLYTRIPRTKSGVELTRDEVLAQRNALIDRIAATTALDRAAVERTLAPLEGQAREPGLGRSMLQLLAGDIIRWRKVRELRGRWMALAPAGRRPSRRSLDDAVWLASRELALAQQVKLLDATHRVFRLWHVAHRPFALTALIAVIVHVVVVIAVGATWLG